MATNTPNLSPLPSNAALEEAFVGKNLRDVPTPAAVVDRAVVERNCRQMLSACEAFHLDFRPHVKTHKVNGRLTRQPPDFPLASKLSFLHNGGHGLRLEFWL